MTLWLIVIAIGAYHGLNPGMGWPLAVSNGLFQRSSRAVVAAMGPLALGHFLAMAAVLLPFSLLAAMARKCPRARGPIAATTARGSC